MNKIEDAPTAEMVREAYLVWRCNYLPYGVSQVSAIEKMNRAFFIWLAEVKEEAFEKGADSIRNQADESLDAFEAAGRRSRPLAALKAETNL
jgi:hypothetical protein